MDRDLEQRFTEAFARLVQTELALEGEVTIARLGRFRTEHIPSTFEEGSDGSTALLPPRDVVVFEAEVQ